jgi:hypothetical protein
MNDYKAVGKCLYKGEYVGVGGTISLSEEDAAKSMYINKIELIQKPAKKKPAKKKQESTDKG